MSFDLEVHGECFSLRADGQWFASSRDFFNTVNHAAYRSEHGRGRILTGLTNLIDLQYFLFAQGWKRISAHSHTDLAVQRWYWRSPMHYVQSLLVTWNVTGDGPVSIHFQTQYPRFT